MAAMSHAERPIQVLVTDAGGGAPAHVRRALAGCADLSLHGAAGGGRTAVALAAELLPEVAVTGDDPETIRAIRACSPATNVVVIAAVADRDRILDAIDAGAGGYLLADDEPASLPDAIRAAARGESPLSPRAAMTLIAGHRPRRRDAGLSIAERHVLALLAQGCTDAVIAERLEVDGDELERLLGAVIAALGVADRTQAALWAQRHDLASADGDPGQHAGPWSPSPASGRIRIPARPAGKRPNGRPHDAEGCEDRPRMVRGRGDGAGARDRRVR
jgi:DNA-binding NarL/FixJ family response regulator